MDLDGVDGALVVAALLTELARVGDALDDGGGDLRHAVDLRTTRRRRSSGVTTVTLGSKKHFSHLLVPAGWADLDLVFAPLANDVAVATRRHGRAAGDVEAHGALHRLLETLEQADVLKYRTTYAYLTLIIQNDLPTKST